MWSKSREEAWQEMESRMDEVRTARVIPIRKIVLVSAAVFLAVIGLTSFFRFYRVTIEAPAGMHKTVLLPDGSKIELNAVSSVYYFPYRWKSARTVTLSGEAHFEVTRGKPFSVISLKGRTEVLGTSFNIYSRKDIYRVTCLSGTVKVISDTRREAVLDPNHSAEVLDNGDIVTHTLADVYPVVSWRNNEFIFTSIPAIEVFSEIERQYNISIQTNVNDLIRYTGNFTKTKCRRDFGLYLSCVGFRIFPETERCIYHHSSG